MNQPLGHPPGFPPAFWTPGAAPVQAGPAPGGTFLDQIALLAGQAGALLLPLLVGLVGGLSTWVILEVVRARHTQRRPRLPGRPPVWVAPRPTVRRKPRAPPVADRQAPG
jgi:hypothetical protein